MSSYWNNTLWSTQDSFQGAGKLHGPGAYRAEQELFSMVLRNLSFTTTNSFLTPFYNNGANGPNICSEEELSDDPDGKLSNGDLINENADICSATIAGTDMLVAVIDDGRYEGQQMFKNTDDGNIEVNMDLALDLNIGDKGVIKIPFYGTTGVVAVPQSLQTALGKKGVDRAGKYSSGTEISGRLGDFDSVPIVDRGWDENWKCH